MNKVSFVIGNCVLSSKNSEYGVTANIPGLGPGDSGFESQYSDKYKKSPLMGLFLYLSE